MLSPLPGGREMARASCFLSLPDTLSSSPKSAATFTCRGLSVSLVRVSGSLSLSPALTSRGSLMFMLKGRLDLNTSSSRPNRPAAAPSVKTLNEVTASER